MIHSVEMHLISIKVLIEMYFILIKILKNALFLKTTLFFILNRFLKNIGITQRVARRQIDELRA